MRRVTTETAAVVIPVKAFSRAKARLAEVLSPEERADLSRSMATTVVGAAGPLAVVVVCDDEEVRAWAEALGVEVLWTPGLGLNGAVAAGRRPPHRPGGGAGDRRPRRPARWPPTSPCVLGGSAVTIVPDRHGDGTNVISLPAGSGFTFAYGAGSCARHVAEAERLGLGVRLVEDERPRVGRRPTGGPRAGGSCTVSLNLPTPAVALAIGAHPDDVEFGCGATLAKWAAAGCVVHHLICTDGSKGSWDVEADTAALVRTRQEEQRAAAKALGATGEQVFLGHVDGELESGLDASVARSRPGSGACAPRSCSATTRGSATASTPTTATPGSSRSRGSSPLGIRTSSPTSSSPTTAPTSCCCSRPTSPTTSRTSPTTSIARSRRCSATPASCCSTMGIDESADQATVEAQRAAFEHDVHARLIERGALEGVALGESYKRMSPAH